MIGLDAILAAIVTVEPPQNGPILFNNILSCFSETTDQSHVAETQAEETHTQQKN